MAWRGFSTFCRRAMIGAHTHGMPFSLSSPLRKILLWLALCAMCLGAVAPSVCRPLVEPAQATELIAICGAHGLTQIRVPAQDSQQNHHHNSPGDDGGDCCSHCRLLHHWPCGLGIMAVPVPHVVLLAARITAADAVVPALQAVRQPYMPQAPPFARG